ncbi:MAG: DUF2017 family protein [Verrucomicrobiales bacterium]|nr:DUF2017 family protein [Verrucomicrobiales bacterium]
MRFQLNEDHWSLDALSPTEWHLVAELPSTAAGEPFCEETKERLFPSHLSPDALADEESLESVEDWKNFVRPDLENTFREAREIVQQDLDKVEIVSMEEYFTPEQFASIQKELPELRRVRVPRRHTEAWYNALNQARLLMNEEHDIASSEEWMLMRMQNNESVDPDRFLIFAQYELYSAVQGMLVENVMEL